MKTSRFRRIALVAASFVTLAVPVHAAKSPSTPARTATVAATPARTAPVASTPTVTQFSPQGIVKQPRQVTARFSAPMVPFGDLRDVAPPFDVDCPAKGSSRWIDATNWAYDFEAPLPGGIRCTFTLRTDLRTRAGAALGGAKSFSFSTGGPTVTSVVPSSGEYQEIDEQQIFVLALDAPVDFAEALPMIGFFVEGLPERIAADRVEGPDLEAILKAIPSWSRPAPPMLAIRARRTFPNGKKVRLQISAGIRSTTGVATDLPQVFEFKTRERFRASLTCTRENARAGCVPIRPIRVELTAAIARDAHDAIRLVAPDGSETAPEPADEDGAITTVVFRGPFLENTKYAVRFPAGLRDDAGRALEGAAPSAKTGSMPVLAKFAAQFGIIERNAEPALPVTLRNIEDVVPASRATVAGSAQPAASPGPSPTPPAPPAVTGVDARVRTDAAAQILGWLRRLGEVSRHRSIFDLPRVAAPVATPVAPADPADAAAVAVEPPPVSLELDGAKNAFTLPKVSPSKETEVVGIALDRPGLHVVELASPKLGAALLSTGKTMYVPAAVLVTNLAVHFQHGRESSIAWVTKLDSATPVGGAHVTVSDCHGKELASAETGADGVARFPSLPRENDLPSCWQTSFVEPAAGQSDASYDYHSSPAVSGLDSGLLVVARAGDDMSFVHSSWDDGIESWRFHISSRSWESPGPAIHTIFDRPLYRQGETVHMKHVLRNRTVATGFEIPGTAARPTKATIEHDGSGESYPFDVAFDNRGLATGEWTIPAAAKLGTYTVTLTAGSTVTTSGTFRVEQFRVPLMHGDVVLPPSVAPRPKSVDVDVAVRYLAGGAASGLPVLLRSRLEPGSFSAPDDYEDFTFAAGPIDESNPYDDDEEADEDDEAESSGEPTSKSLPQKEMTLDAGGSARATLADLPDVDRPTDLVVEAEFRDPNGETVEVATSRTLMPSARVPGIRIDDWVETGEMLHPEVVVLSLDGKPAPDTAVRIEAASRRWLSHRKRLVGGFYEYDNTSETKRLGVLCEGRSDREGRFRCQAKAPAGGQIVLEAIVTDGEGHSATTNTEAWIGDEDSGFETRAGDRIELAPEKRAYEPGETARLQVRMPFREATALVSTVREGVGRTEVVRLSGESPVVELPIRGEDAPNIYVSVLVVRGRVGDVQPTALVDLGRPAFKLGMAELEVDWKTHRLGVDVTSDRELYRTREKAKIHVRVRDHDGKPPEAGSEVAIAAVDEGLLELSDNTSWDLLDEMMSHRSCEVETSTAQGQVIGKRHFGRKALPTGGGGGGGATRELFDTLLLWAPRVEVDASGEADVEVPLNDSLTSFRIVAVATAGAGQFGKGQATIRSNRELSILSGLPPLVREGDRLTAEFTVRNTAQSTLVARASGSATPAGADGAKPSAMVNLAPQEISLDAGQSRVLTWPIDVPAGTRELVYSMRVSAPGAAEDSLAVRERVIPPEPVRIVQSTLAQLDGASSMPVAAPAGAVTNAAGSGIAISASASLAGSVDPMKDWLEHYRYTCLEQRVSIAIGREDAAAWQKIMDDLASYIDGDGLLAYFPGSNVGDDRLTAYVISVAHAAGRTIPEEYLAQMKGGLAGYVAGTVVRTSWLPLPDLTLRKLAAIEALARVGAAEPAMLSTITIQPELWPTSSVLDWWSILQRVPEIAAREDSSRKAENIVRARLDLSGTTLVFSTETQDSIWWMMASPDANAARLLLLLVEHGLWKEDAPRVLRGLLGRRGDDGALQTTLANAWGVLAMRAFAKSFESEPVTGQTSVSLASQSRAIDWSAPEPSAVLLPWPPAEAALSARHDGGGKPWITTTSRAAIRRTEAVAAGYRITRTVRAIDARTPGKWSRGDRIGIRIDIESQRPMWWTVIDDPLPAGASHLATGLGRGAPPPPVPWSQWIQQARDGALWPRYVERAHDSWRAYVDEMPDGHSYVDYAIRLNQAGTFHLPATRVEALYAPEVFGEWPNADLVVEP